MICCSVMLVGNLSYEIGCLWSAERVFAGLYFAKSCWNLGMGVSAVFLGISKRKGCLLKVFQIRSIDYPYM